MTVGDLRFALTNVFQNWADSGPTTISMARALVRKIPTDPSSQGAADSALAAQVLAYRGRVAEAVGLGDNNLPVLLELALIGAVPASESSARCDRPLPGQARYPWRRRRGGAHGATRPPYGGSRLEAGAAPRTPERWPPG